MSDREGEILIDTLPVTSVGETLQNRPVPTKQCRTIVPPPQSLRIRQRYIAGQSIRQIAREEKRDRETVTKIVRSEEVAEYVRNMRERFYGLGEVALKAVQIALDRGDARLAYEYLGDIGVIPDRTLQNQTQNSTAMTGDPAIDQEVQKLAFLTVNMAKAFNQSLPNVENAEPQPSE